MCACLRNVKRRREKTKSVFGRKGLRTCSRPSCRPEEVVRPRTRVDLRPPHERRQAPPSVVDLGSTLRFDDLELSRSRERRRRTDRSGSMEQGMESSRSRWWTIRSDWEDLRTLSGQLEGWGSGRPFESRWSTAEQEEELEEGFGA